MDTDLLKKKLREEVTCSICLEYYTNPVLLDCGHNFCQDCINRCWTEFPANVACPQCRKAITTKKYRLNRPLANVIEILKQLNIQMEDSGDEICRKHLEPSEVVFCKEDQVPLCPVCEGSEQHRDHSMVPLKEAAQEYKCLIGGWIEVLLNEKKEILTHKINAIRESEELMKRAETERQKAVAEFKQLHEFLTDQETFLLGNIQAVARDLAHKRNERLCRLSAELFVLQNTVRHLEEKCQQPDSKFLQDVDQVLRKCEQTPKFKPPEAIPLELKWGTWELRDLNALMEGAAKHFRSTVRDGLQLQEANVTLDPKSAHPQLLVSDDGKSLRWTEMEQDMPETPERFDKHFCVLGFPKFTTGRYFWDVAVEGAEDWAVGVATSSVDRKAIQPFIAEAGFFTLEKLPGSPKDCSELRKIRVSLNCAGGELVFFDAETAKQIYGFSHSSLQRETVRPFFWLKGDTQLSLCYH